MAEKGVFCLLLLEKHTPIHKVEFSKALAITVAKDQDNEIASIVAALHRRVPRYINTVEARLHNAGKLGGCSPPNSTVENGIIQLVILTRIRPRVGGSLGRPSFQCTFRGFFASGAMLAHTFRMTADPT